MEIKQNEDNKKSEEIFGSDNNEKENKIYMVNDIDGFIRLINRK